MTDEQQLLSQYVESHSEEAFSELVSRHIDLVYSVAYRLVGWDSHLAQDIVQTVFTDLSRKAKTLVLHRSLAGWLHRHTFFVASKAIRTEQRRRHREKEAAQMNKPDDSSGPDWNLVSLYLDEALQALGKADRDALILRYLKGLDLKSVGLNLGTNEDAAQKRVSRALDKLRSRLARREVVLTTAALTLTLSSQVLMAAPSGMAAQIAASVLAGSGTASGAALTWIELMAWFKTKTVFVSTAIILATGFASSYLIQRSWSTTSPPSPGISVINPASNNPAPAVNIQRQPIGFHWSQVESPDYRQYIANLRAIGCPEETIRDIIMADLNQHYIARAQFIFSRPAPVYWKKNQNINPTPEQLKQLIALDKEKTAIFKELLGISIDAQDVVNTAFTQVHSAEEELLFLPADKREAASQVLRESGMDEKIAEFKRKTSFRGDADQQLFNEKLKVLSKVLSAEELEEFRLRHSPLAQTLRNEASFLDCTPEEFKLLLASREKRSGERYQGLEALREKNIQEVRQLLGEDRAQQYQRVSDHGYLNARWAAQRAGVTVDLADQAGQIAYESRVAVEQIATNPQLDLDEKRRQIEILKSDAEKRLNGALGNQLAYTAIWQAVRNTLDNTMQTFLR